MGDFGIKYASSLSKSVSLLLLSCSVMILAFVEAQTTLKTDTLAQASRIHWQIVA